MGLIYERESFSWDGVMKSKQQQIINNSNYVGMWCEMDGDWKKWHDAKVLFLGKISLSRNFNSKKMHSWQICITKYHKDCLFFMSMMFRWLSQRYQGKTKRKKKRQWKKPNKMKQVLNGSCFELISVLIIKLKWALINMVIQNDHIVR